MKESIRRLEALKEEYQAELETAFVETEGVASPDSALAGAKVDAIDEAIRRLRD